MPPSAIEQAMPESACLKPCEEKRYRFPNLRGVQWRIDLGVLPSPSSSSVDDLRRVTANSRRRYAGLRRRLLVDPHLPKDGSNSPDLAIDNPLSQNPDSTWGRFFRNAELEKTVDQDLTRLYPEHGSYFQTLGCQAMLRRILLLWCLRHPEYGYRPGMHELLAPLLYVLHVDVERLSEVRKLYEDHFTDKFDDVSFHENDLIKRYLVSMEDEINPDIAPKVKSLNDLDPEIQTIVSLSDAYGAEGELGIVLSDKFMEHDAYCMFDSLMNGSNGVVSMAYFFSPIVIEASAELYHLLSIVDTSLHSHLVELGVEPQYFALRWLRVLFGREFSLQNLLIIWDEIFAASNSKVDENDTGSGFCLFTAPRGAFIAAIAVSIILYLRSSLLATENATTCLQRLLNFPENIDLEKFIEKAKSLQALALGSNISSKSMVVSGHTLSISPRTPLNSYWEEKWRVLHKAEENSEKRNKIPKKGWSEKAKWTLSRTESDPSPEKVGSAKKNCKSSTRRRLLDDLSRELGLEDDIAEKARNDQVSGNKDCILRNNDSEVEVKDQDIVNNAGSEENKDCILCNNDSEVEVKDRDIVNNADSEENSSVFSDPTSPLSNGNNPENDLEKSSVASNLSICETDNHSEAIRGEIDHDTLQSPLNNSEPTEKSLKERKLLSGKFQWFWKFGRSNVGEETPGGSVAKSSMSDSSMCSSAVDENSKSCGKGEAADQNVMGTLRNLGHSMLEHIQVIESVFQQDRGQGGGSLENFSKNVIVGKGQVTAMTALTELRKVSNLLSEM